MNLSAARSPVPTYDRGLGKSWWLAKPSDVRSPHSFFAPYTRFLCRVAEIDSKRKLPADVRELLDLAEKAIRAGAGGEA